MNFLIDLVLLSIGLCMAIGYAHWRTSGMNVPRMRKRKTTDVFHYEDMTPAERRANGVVPLDELPLGWQEFYKYQKGGKGFHKHR